jgi:sugar transferase (PEP-CTERM/EpsH1 system associated)
MNGPMSKRTRDADGRCGVTQVVENLEIGGLEKVVLSLVKNLAGERYRSSVVCLGYGGELLQQVTDSATTVHVLEKQPGFDLGLLWRLSKLLRRTHTDVVHCHNMGPLIYGALAAKIARCSGVVYTAHGMKTSAEAKPVLFDRMGLIDDFVTVSEDARRIAIDVAGAKRDRVETVINGVDVDALAGAAAASTTVRAQRRAQIGVPDDAVVFGIVARLSAAKDHANLFLAFASVAAGYDKARLVLVGDGELRDDLTARAGDLGLSDRIVFLGSRHDVPELLGALDVFVLSSYTEGLAVTLLEAMAAGLPVVATDVGGNGEVVENGQTGLIVPPRDPDALSRAMRWMIEHGDEAGGMGKRGRWRVEERFSIGAMVRSYCERYDRISGKRPTEPRSPRPAQT